MANAVLPQLAWEDFERFYQDQRDQMCFSADFWRIFADIWVRWQAVLVDLQAVKGDQQVDLEAILSREVDCLIDLFNATFVDQNVVLVRGLGEPEYFPATADQPARIEFAHGFFASALHEVSHWCLAGKKRRTLADFGYWYEPDGRDFETQRLFEQVEIKPQALECLFTQACGKVFRVSQDNLSADFDTTSSTFAQDVAGQAQFYLNHASAMPTDARVWLCVLLMLKFENF